MSKKTAASKSKKGQYHLDLRADSLAFDLMCALSGFTFEITSRTTKVITLSAQAERDTEPVVVTVTRTDYVINGTHYPTCDEAVQVLSPKVSTETQTEDDPTITTNDTTDKEK